MHTRTCPSCHQEVQHETKYARDHREKNQIPCNSCLGLTPRPPEGDTRYCPMCSGALVCPSPAAAKRGHKEERLCSSCAGRHRRPPSVETRMKLADNHRGRKRSDATKKKLSDKAKERWKDPVQRETMLTYAAKGRESARSASSREKMRSALRGRKLTFSQAHRERLGEACRQRTADPSYRAKLSWTDDRRIETSIMNGGSGNLECLNDKRRRTFWKGSALSKWRIAVKRRDERRCRHCGSTDDLHAHHIMQRSSHPELAYDVENGITLCKSCHVEEHRRMRADFANGVR